MFNDGKTLLAGFSIIQSTTNRMKPGEKEVNTLLRNVFVLLLSYSNDIENYHSVESEKVSKSAEGQFGGKI